MHICETKRFSCLLLALLTLIIFSNSFTNAFQFDDWHVIEKNTYIKNPANFSKFFYRPVMGSGIVQETSAYRPLLLVSFAFNHYLGGLNVFGYHLLNVFIHILCAILVYFIVLFLTQTGEHGQEGRDRRSQWLAFFAAVFFAVHPVQTESVTYITGRSSSLMALFFLLSLWGFLKYGAQLRIQYLILSFIGYACALLVKETAITLVPILAFYIFLFPLGRSWKRRLFSLVPHILLSGIYLLLRWHFFGSLQYGDKPIRPLYEQILTQFRAWVHNLGTLLLPLNLNIDYDFPISHSIREPQVLLAILILTVLAGGIWHVSRRRRLVGFFALWFAVTLAPTSSIVPLEDVVADRWLYLPSIGFIGIAVLAGEWLFKKAIRGKPRIYYLVFFFLCALPLELYAFSTVLRNFTWRSEWTLWEDTVEKSPDKARARIGLGLAYMNAGRHPEAVRQFEWAMKLDPKDGRAYLNLGIIYYWQNRNEEAITLYRKAIRFGSRLASEGHNNIALAYLKMGKKQEALKEFQRSIEIRPINANPYYNLGVYYGDNGDMDTAISYLEKAVEIEPEFYWAYMSLSRVYERKGCQEKSKEAYLKYAEKALKGINYMPGR